MNWLLSHPTLLLWLFPFILSGALVAIGRAEKSALAYLFSRGDVIDQEAVRGTVAVWVTWAEKRAAPDAAGSSKFAQVDRLLARVFPFLSADERKDIIEKSVAAMDKAAHDSLDTPTPQKPAAGA